nr:hypothetical protein [Tanacetum cinerariifolium]
MTYSVESIRQRRPENITPADWDAQIAFWNDPKNQARSAQNRQNRAKSTVVCRQGSRSLARLRDQMGESSTELSNARGSSGCEDDEMAKDEKGNEDEEDEEDGDS